MTALPAATDFTGATVTEGQFKTAMTNQRSYLAGLFGTDGAIGTAMTTLGVPLNDTIAKTGAYSVVAGDRGRLFLCSGTWSLTLLAAATAGDGFCIGVRNTGTGTITLDGNLSETIDGATTLAMTAGQSLLLVCTGAAWYTVGLSSAAGGSDMADAAQSSTYTCSTTETTVFQLDITLAATADVFIDASCRVELQTASAATVTGTVYVYLDATLLNSVTLTEPINADSADFQTMFAQAFVVEAVASGSHSIYLKAKRGTTGGVIIAEGNIAASWTEV
jgi:hypothetical protein